MAAYPIYQQFISDYSVPAEIDSKNSPYVGEKLEYAHIDDGVGDGLNFYHDANGNKIYAPRSIMNDNVAINYRTIYNGYAQPNNSRDFTEYNDYLRCINLESKYKQYLQDKKNPTYQKILDYYDDPSFDPHGLSRYKIQDFIYCKYYNQIPNNHMITLRRYTRPCEDHVFGLDMPVEDINALNGYPSEYFAVATAVTYMGEQTGNKLSDIMKFDYGAKWEDKTAEVQSLTASEGGLAAQMKEKLGIEPGYGSSLTQTVKNSFIMGALARAKGSSGKEAIKSQYKYQGNEFAARYGDEFFGDINVVDSVKMRSRGLTFSNNFSLTFEYSLKSLRCVNPKIAMMDILSNFLILTGNYGTFWGGATMFFGVANIAPQFGDPEKLRQGDWRGYFDSLTNDVMQSFKRLKPEGEDKGVLQQIMSIGGDLLKNGWDTLMNNVFGGKIGIAGQSQMPKALLSAAPSGFWHLTIGNPLDPIAMMGNMAVTKTTVQFNDILGYDDFPTEIKFTVEMEHCRPRDNAGIEAMFNAGKGRFYSFTNLDLENQFHYVSVKHGFVNDSPELTKQEVNAEGDGTGNVRQAISSNRLKIIGAVLNN